MQQLIALYSQSAQEHAQSNINSTKITAIVSIVCIVIVGFIVAPFLTNAEMRKFRAILYFLKIPNDVLPQMIRNCEYCLNMNNEQRYLEIEHDYERFLGLKISNQQVYQLRQAKEEEVNRSNQQRSSGFTGTETYDDNLGSQADYRTEDNGSLVSGKRSQATTGSRRKGRQQSMAKIASEIKEEIEEEDDHDDENLGEGQKE